MAEVTYADPTTTRTPLHFDVLPTIKIPKFDRPGLPDIFKPIKPQQKPQVTDKPIPGQPKPTVEEPKPKPEPELKEKDIPRLRKPKPKPIPNDLTRQLRELDLSPCGSISFGIVYATKATGETYIPELGYFKVAREASSLEEMFAIYKKAYPDSDADKISFFESSGGTGAIASEDLGGTASYRYYQALGTYATRSNGYPYYYADGGTVEVTGANSRAAIGRILDKFSEGEFKPEVYKINVSHPSAEDCPIGKPPPPPDPPPDPPPEDCDCMAQCCPDIDLRQIKALMEEVIKETKKEINVPVIECKQNTETGKWEPKTTQKTLEVFAASQEQADQIANLHIANAQQATQLCEAKNNDGAIASIPLSWQIRHEGERPQMVIQCAEKKPPKEGEELAKYASAMYPITVPHWKGGQNDKPSLPPYKKGNWEGILVLQDNSKVTINAQNEAECTKILNAIKPWIKSDMLEGSYFKGGKIVTKEPIKDTQVKPMYGRYFGKGQRNGKPDWRVDFP